MHRVYEMYIRAPPSGSREIGGKDPGARADARRHEELRFVHVEYWPINAWNFARCPASRPPGPLGARAPEASPAETRIPEWGFPF